jgi:hypothetical protein
MQLKEKTVAKINFYKNNKQKILWVIKPCRVISATTCSLSFPFPMKIELLPNFSLRISHQPQYVYSVVVLQKILKAHKKPIDIYYLPLSPSTILFVFSDWHPLTFRHFQMCT